MALVACGPLWAAEDEDLKALTKPPSTIDAGIGVVSEDNTRFGQYTGLTKQGLYPLIDLDLRNRDDETGTWFNLFGRNLGLESNELRLEHQRQGSWGYFLEYGQTPRYSPYTPVTRLDGIGTTNQVVNGVANPREVELKTVRKNFNGGLDSAFASAWNVSFRFSTENKEGNRLFGRSGSGTTGSFQEFLVDPIDYRTQTWEATVGYTTQKLQLVGAYYGTNFTNSNPRIDASGTPSTFSPIALPPDNESHKLSVSGGYTFTQDTRATFKVAYQKQTQTATFIDPSSTGRSDLGGRVDTTFLQGGLNSRVTKDLTLNANLRYENRNDRTPVVDYFNFTTTNTATGVNEPRSIKNSFGKLEGVYRLGGGYTAAAGVDYEVKERNTSDVRVVSFRDRTNELAERLELRRAMSETLNGSVAVIHSNRTGSPWQTTVITNGTTGSNLVAPLQLADRDRNMLRGRLGWQATEAVDFQFVADISKDTYGGRSLGLSDGQATHFAIDAGARLTDTLQLTAWISQEDTRSKLNSCENASSVGVCPNTAADPMWQANLRNISNALGAGLRGRPREKLELGGDIQYSMDTAKFDQGPDVAGVQPVPNTHIKHATFRLYAKQEYSKNVSIRLRYVYDRYLSDDWTWSTWTYGDGTTVLSNPSQKVQFIGLQMQYNL
jgi:MtrB/PioB family decaheme-associated outer membrane protein